MKITRDPFTVPGFVNFYIRGRFGGILMNNDALQVVARSKHEARNCSSPHPGLCQSPVTWRALGRASCEDAVLASFFTGDDNVRNRPKADIPVAAVHGT